MFRWFLFKLQIKLSVLSLLQGKVSITSGPGWPWGFKYAARGQTLKPFLNNSVLPVSGCSFPLPQTNYLLLFASCWKTLLNKQFPLASLAQFVNTVRKLLP